MAGTLTIDTLKASTGVLATQNGMTGIAKAWVKWNGSGGAVIASSFNVSSVTRSATGTYAIAFTTSMSDANYSISFSSESFSSFPLSSPAPTSSGFSVQARNTGNTNNDVALACVSVFSA